MGLIANSVSLKSDTIQNRFLAFKSALSHFLYYPAKHRILTIGVLTGIEVIASPELAKYYLTALETMGAWLTNWGELFTVTAQAGFEWASMDGIYKAYIEGDKPVHLAKGLTALVAIGLGSIGVLHLGANFADMAKHIRSNKGQKHQEKVNGFLKQIKSAKNNFINYVEKNRAEFTHNLSNAERKKLGIPVIIKLGLNDIESQQILKTAANMDSLYSALESNKKLFLEITAQKESGILS